MNFETSSSVSSSGFSSSSFRSQSTTSPSFKDAKPKTTGSVGIMLVGIGGYNGTTLLAGIMAHRLNITWRGPFGDIRTPNYNGCITQLNMKGGGVGFKDRVKGLADATSAAVGGWDIRPTKCGDALLEQQILDYDLVRQVQDDLNKINIFKGAYDSRFIGPSQHATATHILTDFEAPNASETLKCIRADIRYFKWKNGVVGHTTVIWSASVEPNSELVGTWKSADELLAAFEQSESQRGGPIPPSLIYATAALLEGCSFINGGSQNTLGCPGLMDLARQQQGVYCLGTDFKAGQTKFKTAAVEYLRTMGLTPLVIASSNHLGNNDMRNLASAPDTSKAKLRVKHDIFAPWEENIDHKVSIMYTELINDEKRDFVEYTSAGFLGQLHTMVTYTRASDSVLCVPLILDGAVWCDFFSRCSWPYEKVAKALAYLFKVPEGAATGADPGFFAQMRELDAQAMAANESRGSGKDAGKRVRIITNEKAKTEWAVPEGGVICAGLACVDMQLNNATGGDGGEGIESFQGEKSIGGGSVSMACKTLARLCHGEAQDSVHAQTPAVLSNIVPICKIGMDGTGDKLLNLLEATGETCRNVNVRHLKNNRDPEGRTALSVLPIYRDGRRGCFFDAASNVTFSAKEIISDLKSLRNGENATYGAFLFGYPHLLPELQGQALAQVLIEARNVLVNGGICAVDLNGVPEVLFQRDKRSGLRADMKSDPVIGAALQHTDILHMNEEELCLLTGCIMTGNTVQDDGTIRQAVKLFLDAGVGIVVVTRGKLGSVVYCNSKLRPTLPASWEGGSVATPASMLARGTMINSNGAGDAFTAGFLLAAMLRHTGVDVKDDAEMSSPSSRGTPTKSPAKKQLTPYALYMQENYLTLKTQLQGDKKAIFSKCHELWENESPAVKAMYERRASEENNTATQTEDVNSSFDSSQMMTDSIKERTLSLESAATLATLIAARHIDVSTRDDLHLDLNTLLEHCLLLPNDGLEEI
ncbi:hypothetical protein FisN_6Hh344 [Fistulifera solaris]|uniref:inositol-3-phosphate synthase n=1 Tax=Fistulifera solaris TaxID=1519565 RepID=A0A1Z5K7A0_FISSO|nr:hypothetical protein FisN_6Hh344 [Fistulifera solaris]|eukprot:GAX22096.1 hypothetical protein FisN_6Hh344 [Fistulifera solaris]